MFVPDRAQIVCFVYDCHEGKIKKFVKIVQVLGRGDLDDSRNFKKIGNIRTKKTPRFRESASCDYQAKEKLPSYKKRDRGVSRDVEKE